MSPTAPCPACAGTAVPLVYGFPDGATAEAADRGELALAGCTLPLLDEPPADWECGSCQHRFA